jgi:Siphovirus ReqiPepy6 Gp37-like protein
MDLLRLDNTTLLPDLLVENYSSLIWTDRYSGEGEFELRTPDVWNMLTLLPQGQLISLLDDPEVMIVETRNIEVDDDGFMTLVVTGGSLETMLRHRALLASVYNTPWKVLQTYKTSEFASLLLWNHLVNATGEDPTRAAWTIDSLTAIPNLVITETVPVPGDPAEWWLESGQVYDTFKGVLDLGILGVRAIRPSHTAGTILTFDTSRTASRGLITRNPEPDIMDMRLDVYQGTNRTRYQSVVEPVMFHYDSGHIDNPKYLFSIKDHKTMASVSASFGSQNVLPAGAGSGGTGLTRRVLYLDGGDATNAVAVTQKGRIELRKHEKVRMFDGAITPTSAYQFGRDYFLGDVVTLLAQRGFEETMVVSEYIRTHDENGDNGYPGLIERPD